MEHILTECTILGQTQVWEIMKNIWRGTGEQWSQPNYGETIGISSITPKISWKNGKDGWKRLYQILISEGAHIIWKLRCNKVLNHDNKFLSWPTTSEITNTIKNCINLRL
jgi:hypothetical protein